MLFSLATHFTLNLTLQLNHLLPHSVFDTFFYYPVNNGSL